MKLTDQDLLELHQLLDRLVEKNLSQTQREKLEAILTQSEEARQIYVAYMDMSASLCHYADETLACDDADEESERTWGNQIIDFVQPLLPFAALFLLGAYIFQTYQPSPDFQPSQLSTLESQEKTSGMPPGYEDAEADAVAVLTQAVGLRWANTANSHPEIGSSITPGDWQVLHGFAQVEFMQGATVIFEGPFDARFVHSNAAVLRKGKLRAHVPKVATGFTVDLPKGRVVDIGTDFGLQAHEEGSAEVYVYRGKVRYEGMDDFGNEIVRELSGGEALFLDVNGVASELDMPSGNYLGTLELANRSMEMAHRRRAAWAEHSKMIAEQKGTILFYGFDNHDSWSRVVKDETQSGKGSGNGAVIGCKWAEGRWPGKGALQFSQKNDRVCLNLTKPLESATLSAWVRVDRINGKVAPIVFSRPHLPGAFCWSIDSLGKIVLGVNALSGVERYSSPVALSRDLHGKWVHLATTFDARDKWVKHYLNGRSFSSERVGFADSISLKKGLLGHTQGFRGYNPNIALDGCIDEFAIFDSAWSERDIRKLFEVGSPFDHANKRESILP